MEILPQPAAAHQHRPYLGVHFIKCHVYGRLYRTLEGTAYFGRCPRCGAPVRVPIGHGGTSQRFFQAACP
jgi:hypothetical protein